ncbi:MAG: hypothetical protein RL329_3059 [Bacteroidota bacterium]
MRDKIINYLENELSPQEVAAFEQALTVDPDLRKAFDFEKKMHQQLTLLRFNSKATGFLDDYDRIQGQKRWLRFAAGAAIVLLLLGFLFNYNSLINWIQPKVPAQKVPNNMVADKPVITPIPPVATVVIPPQTPKQTQLTTLKSTPTPKTPDMPVETVDVDQALPTKVGSSKPNDSIFVTPQVKDIVSTNLPLDGATITLDNMYDFKGDNGLIFKHLSKIDCKNYTVSFVIKVDGTVESPQWEMGDKNCEIMLLNQIKTMPLLKKPIYDGKAVDYRYFFTKN